MEKGLAAILLSVATALAALFLYFWLMGSPGLGFPIHAQAAAGSPTVTAVNPALSPNDLDVEIIITGTNFTAGATAALGKSMLEDVGWVSSTSLTATVSWGMEPGVYTLTVENPDGKTGSLTDAFTVTQGFGVWNTGGPYGGKIIGLAVNPITPTTIFAYAHDAGLFASYDGAEHWQQILLDGWPNLLDFDAGDPQVMYFGSKDNLLRTKNGGSDWVSIKPGNHNNLYPFAHPATPGVLYAGSTNPPGLYRSNNYGNSWLPKTNGMTDTYVLAVDFDPLDPDKMLAGTRDGNVYYSSDGGNNWEWKAILSDHVERLYFNPNGAHEAWATSEAVQGTSYHPTQFLYKSEQPDLDIWEPISVELGNYVASLTFLTDTIWSAGGVGFTTTDVGENWYPISNEGLEQDWYESTMDFDIHLSDPATIYMGDFGHALYKSSDSGSTWSKKNEGLTGVVPRGLVVDLKNIDTVYAETYVLGILKSDNGGQTWYSLGIGEGGFRKPLAIDPNLNSRVYIGEQGAGYLQLQISENAGDSWDVVTDTIPSKWNGWNADILDMAPHPNISGTIFAGARVLRSYALKDAETEQGAIFTSEDYGGQWDYMGPTQPISGVVEIAFDAEDPDLVYAATSGTGLWKSADGGENWGEVTTFPGGQIIWTVVAHPDIPDTVYVRAEDPTVVGAPAYVSQDAGENWEELPANINSNTLLFAPSERRKPKYTLYTTAWSQPEYSGLFWPVGLYRSMDGGYNWEQVPGAPTTDYHALAVGSEGERVMIYGGISGGFASSQPQSASDPDVIPDGSEIIPSGVYRWGNLLRWEQYFPLIAKDNSP